MSTEYQIPKRKIEATVSCLGEPEREIWLYVGERAECHFGPERPSDLLNAGGRFIPATDHEGRFTLLQRDAISVVTVPLTAEQGPDVSPPDSEAEPAISYRIRVRLIGARQVTGTLSFVRPEGQQRLQDGLSNCERFFAVRDDDQVHLLNRGHVVWIVQDGPLPR